MYVMILLYANYVYVFYGFITKPSPKYKVR